MSGTSKRPLPLLRLALYLVILGVCGAVAWREVYYALASTTTTATILAVGRNARFAQRSSTYWAEYEYVDAQGTRHVGRAESFTLLPDGVAPPTAVRGDPAEIQYLRATPQTSRMAPSPAGGLCFGAIALLAGVVFIAELLTRWHQRRRARRPKDAEIDSGTQHEPS